MSIISKYYFFYNNFKFLFRLTDSGNWRFFVCDEETAKRFLANKKMCCSKTPQRRVVPTGVLRKPSRRKAAKLLPLVKRSICFFHFFLFSFTFLYIFFLNFLPNSKTKVSLFYNLNPVLKSVPLMGMFFLYIKTNFILTEFGRLF